ncbi:hypothetical protein K2173_014887 [Erythroxylum novogranatense]|uniref:Uncharacterized protein n=1 Tax=Erythroxylum novogranatense TaxID=1862640 RepID=A0AAV8TIB5_9ROSI|nr:hypothetical protein K2173_014887 [Erythroxylum novogranatense]
MAITIVARAVGGLFRCVSTLWGLQEHRFTLVFDAVSSGVVFVANALLFCFSSIRRPRGHHEQIFGIYGHVSATYDQ